jgi:hypothetical protein
LIPIVTEPQKVSDAMEIKSFNYSIERGILLRPHVVKINPLHRDYKLGLSVEHYVIRILMKKGPEALIGAPFFGLDVTRFLAHLHNLGGLNLVLVYHCLIVVDFHESHL